MTQLNFQQMSRAELRAYILEHRDDEQAFHAYMDKLKSEPVLANGTLGDLEDSARFSELLERVQKTKQERRRSDF
ncbi:MAG: hypothetical protein KME30_10170 [Iphinoe sp. HA4291-MV1]|jgi:hypothetical protein|nr:hypothetical protein [Iphinoe sp. HA4291-MV1]